MPGTGKAFRLVSCANGHVLAKREDGKPSDVVVENYDDQQEQEMWTIETGDEPNVIALKNSADGHYLHANGGGSWATVCTGEKQWWNLTRDVMHWPGAFRLSPVQYPDVALNHFNGQTARKGAVVKVHMWRWPHSHPQWFSWYIVDAEAKLNPTEGANGSEASRADFDSKLKALEERDYALKQKDQDSSAEWDRKMKELQDRQASAAKEEQKRTSEYEQELKDMQAREAALAEQEKQAKLAKGKPDDKKKQDSSKVDAQRAADVQKKLDAIKAGEQKLATDQAALKKSQSDLAKKEKDLAQRQKEFDNSKTSKAPASSTSGKTASGKSPEDRLNKTQQDNTNLEQRLAKLEDQLANMSKDSKDVPTSKPQANGTGSASKPSSSDPGCGYKHYKPPRKLNRKLIGMIYE